MIKNPKRYACMPKLKIQSGKSKSDSPIAEYNLKFDTCKKAKSLNPFIFKEFKTFLLFQKMRTIF